MSRSEERMGLKSGWFLTVIPYSVSMPMTFGMAMRFLAPWRTETPGPRVMGIETEYGITVKNQPDFNPILSSLLLINSYETFRSSRVRWDYEAESPLRDARGFEYMEEKEGTSKEESRLINLILSNGARFYVEH